MKIIKIFYFSFVLILLLQCKDEPTQIETSFFSKSIEKLNMGSNVKWVVLLPGLGCPGCIQEGEAFMKEHIDDENIIFVLTKIESLKILQKKMNIDIKDHTNVYIDKEKAFEVPTDNVIYPCILEVEMGVLKEHGFQSPSNSDAFVKLKRKMEKL